MKTLKDIQARVSRAMPYLAWVSFALALVGGTLLPATALGRLLRDLIQAFPVGWAPHALFAGAILGIILDIGRDLIPDRIAVYSAALAPTVASAITGKLAEKVTAFGEWMSSWMSTPLNEWTGITDTTGQAVVALVLAYVIAKRVVKDRKAAKGRKAAAMLEDVSV